METDGLERVQGVVVDVVEVVVDVVEVVVVHSEHLDELQPLLQQ
jgi:hypothetical protein